MYRGGIHVHVCSYHWPLSFCPGSGSTLAPDPSALTAVSGWAPAGSPGCLLLPAAPLANCETLPHTYTYVCMYMYKNIMQCVYMYVYVYYYVYECVSLCVYVCESVCLSVCVQCTYIHVVYIHMCMCKWILCVYMIHVHVHVCTCI